MAGRAWRFLRSEMTLLATSSITVYVRIKR